MLAEAVEVNPPFASDLHFVDAGRLWTRGSDSVVRWYGFQEKSLTLRSEAKLPEKFAAIAADDEKLYGLQPDRRLAVVEAATGRALPPIALDDVVIEDVTTETGEKRRRIANLGAVAVAAKSRDIAVQTNDGRLNVLAGGDAGRTHSRPIGMHDVLSLAADPTGRFLAVHGGDGGLLIFDRENPETPRWLERGAGADSLAAPRFDSHVKSLISLQNAQSILVSEIATGRPQRRYSRPVAEGAKATAVTSLCGHQETVYCGTSAGAIEVFRPGAASPKVIPLGAAAVTALAASPKGDAVLAGDAAGSVGWIDPATSAARIIAKQSGPVHPIAFSPDGHVAAISSGLTVAIWDVADQRAQRTLNGHEHPVQALAFSPDSQSLVTGDARGRLIRWGVAAGNRIASYSFRGGLVAPTPSGSQPSPPDPDGGEDDARLPGTDHGITAIAFSRDQRVLAAGTGSGYSQTFDLERGTELSLVFHRSSVTDLVFAEDGASLLVATQSGEASRWWRAPDPPRLLAGHQGSVRFVALNAAGRRAVTGGVDRQLRVWDVEQRSLIRSFDNGGEAITAGALSPDGLKAVTSGYGSGIVLWDLAEMKSLGKRYGHKKRVWSFDFTPEGTTFASGSDDQTVRLWDFASQKLKRTLELDAPVHFVRFSPDGTKLVTSTVDPRGWQFPARLQLWNAATGKPLGEFRGHRTTVNSAVFSRDGSELTSWGADGQICRWKAATAERLSDVDRPHGLSHAGLVANGELLVMRRFSTGVFIDRAGSMTRLAEFDVATRSIGDLNVAAEGGRIIAGTEEGPVYVWSLRP